MSRHIVFLGSAESVFVVRTSKALEMRGVKVSLIDPYIYCCSPSIEKGRIASLRQLFYRLKYIRRRIQSYNRDLTVVIHSLSIETVFYIPLLSRYFSRVIGLAYGSDILRRRHSRDWLLKLGLERLDAVLATNDNVLDEISRAFPTLKNKAKDVIRFGLPVFDVLDQLSDTSPKEARSMLGLPIDTHLVCLGYSACTGQRQTDLIDLMEVHINSLSHCHFVVLAQYGDSNLQAQLVEKAAKANAAVKGRRFIVITEFHDLKKTALMRKACDVLINHSLSDAFSGTVQEAVYAGNLVFSIDHLPYENMPGFGSAIRSYRDAKFLYKLLELGAMNRQCELALSNAVATREELRHISSWDHVYKDWLALVDGVWPK